MRPSILEIVAQSAEVAVDCVRTSTDLHEDLGLDSVGRMHIVLAIEDAYGVTLSEEDIASVSTVSTLIELVARRGASHGGGSGGVQH